MKSFEIIKHITDSKQYSRFRNINGFASAILTHFNFQCLSIWTSFKVQGDYLESSKIKY